MNILENISLKAFNTFGISKNARFFTVCTSIDEIKDSLSFAAQKNLPVFILGGGSNILLTKDLEALVIKIKLKGVKKIKEDKDFVWVEVGAGEIWHEWVMTAIKNNWSGIENLSLIPGTVGASPMQNIGAYGVEIKEVFEELKALNRKTLQIESFDSQACKFGYRESVFKHELKDQYIICSVTFRLQKNPVFKTEYGAILETLRKKEIKNLSIKAISDAVISIRESKLPNPKEIGNAGSFFKNPTISNEQFETIRKNYPEIPRYTTEEGVKIPAAWLIEQAGWKGKRFGEIGVHEKHPLVLVNYGEGEGKEIKTLSEKIQESVLEKFGIQLTPEVNFL